MESAQLPKNEKERLERLEQYNVLDTPAEEAFDSITRIVAETIGVPISLVSLVDRERQWFKSRYGLDAPETPRDIAFCSHVILEDELFIVEDATKDERFSDNPLVINDPSIRFYAGPPLRAKDGLNLGTLCAIDRVPRTLSDKEKQLLDDLSKLVVNEMELRLALQGAKAQVANEVRIRAMQDEFLETINHELRTPLTSIRGSLEVLEKELFGKLPDKIKEMISIAYRNSSTLLRLINELLDVQKLNAENSEYAFEMVDIENWLKDTCENLKGYTLRDNITLNVTCDPFEPIMIDPNRLGQAISNLVSNAVKFSPKNSSIDIEARKNDETLVLKVTDRGAGIPKEFRPKLFAKFTQANNTDQKSGTGLGLAITRSIVEAHQGEISFETEVGKGSSFQITIPIKDTFIPENK